MSIFDRVRDVRARPLPKPGGADPLGENAAKVARRIVDPAAFCPECGSDDQVLHDAADTVTFSATGETAPGYVCARCKVMWTPRTARGQQLRAEVGSRSISAPGAPTRPYTDPARDPRLIAEGMREDPRIRSRKAELRRDVAYYADCRVTGHPEGRCRCREIERKWSGLWRERLS